MHSIAQQPPGCHAPVAPPWRSVKSFLAERRKVEDEQFVAELMRREEVRAVKCEWRRLARAIADPFFELTTDDYDQVIICYRRLKRLEVKIDPMAEAMVLQAAYSMAGWETFVDG